MGKPQPKREVNAAWYREDDRIIAFEGSPDAVTDFSSFGPIQHLHRYYHLYVDGRYDFQEVLDYIKDYDG